MLSIKTLEATSIEEITKTFNKAFLNYYFPITLSSEQIINKFASEGGKLNLSVGAFANERLVGFILHFLDIKKGKKYIYNGGTGVIETYRGNKITSQMYDYISPILKDENIDHMILEVLTENTPAITVYQKQGFKKTRELLCFNGKLNGVKSYTMPQGFKIMEIVNPDWSALHNFWDYEPTWQNSTSTIQHFPEQKQIIGIEKDNNIIGYIVYNHKFRRIHQMAIAKEYRNIGLGSNLLNYIYNLQKESISLINIDTRIKAIKPFLEKRGLNNYTNQFEMEKKLQ